jgi:hypothetical protein
MFIYDLKLQDKYNTSALSKHIGKYVYSARIPFLSLMHILPICFDSAQVLYIYTPAHSPGLPP